MKIDYTIKEFPKDLSKSYALDSYTEGVLTLRINEITLFSEDGILLVEFCAALQDWVNKNNSSDFVYESMDFEESPIIAFIYSPESNTYDFQSIWKLSDGTVSFSEIKEAFSVFRNELADEIYKRSGCKL